MTERLNANKTHDDLIADWTANAEKHEEKNYQFLRNLKRNCTSFENVDRIALELHQEAFSIVDCTRCANCCKTMPVIVNDEDIARITEHLGMAPEEFVAAYLDKDEKENRYRIRTVPCPFLGEDNKCKIYDVRPGACKGYPYTEKDFLRRTIYHTSNAVICPAVFYIVEQMKKRMRRS